MGLLPPASLQSPSGRGSSLPVGEWDLFNFFKTFLDHSKTKFLNRKERANCIQKNEFDPGSE